MPAYALTGHAAEADRLRFLSSTVAEMTEAVLGRVFVPPAARVLDVGSGTGRLAADLATGDRGREVVGVDVDPALLEAARSHAAERGLGNVRFETASVTALPYADAAFDLVTCRFVLMHVPDPAAAVAEMRRVCRPGGALVVIESDWDGQLLHPMTPGVRRLRELGVRVARRMGINPNQGRELFGLMRAAGLDDITVTAHAEVSTADDPRVVAEKLRARVAALRHFASVAAENIAGDLDEIGDIGDIGAVEAVEAEVEALLRAPDLFATEFRVAATGRVPLGDAGKGDGR
ncbi:methyltransferase domain-containing protein [Microbispora hainanensis]|uniref:class I SAM-dependent methyltransferase n=1 Tax=Microbispora hainanensis TaxID=568844 RepID=UPI0034116CCE